MRTSHRPSKLAALRLLAALAVGGGACAVYLMACQTPDNPSGPGGPLVITTTSPLPAGQVGAIYCSAGAAPCVFGLALAFTASGGEPTYTWSHPRSTNPFDILPFGLTLDPNTGYLEGKPTAAGTYTFTVMVTDQMMNSTSASFTVTIGGGVLMITPTSLPNGFVTVPYAQQLGVVGGMGPYTWTETGPLPPSLGFSSGGDLTGNPTAAGFYPFYVLVTDAATPPNMAWQPFTMNIATAPPVPPVLMVQESSLTFTAMFGEPSTVSGLQTANVTATGGTANGLSAQISYAQGASPWLLAPVFSAASTPPTVGVVFGVNPADAGLPPGSYSAIVTISSTTPGVVPVALTVNFVVTAPVLVLGTNPLTFNSTVGAIPPPQPELVTTSTGVSVTLQSPTIAYVSGAGGWLSVQGLPSGGGSSPVTLQVGMSSAAQGLPASTYTATVTITSGIHGVAPVVLNVSLVIAAPPVLGLGTNPMTFNTSVGVIPPYQSEQVTSTGGPATLQSATVAYGPGASNWLAIAGNQAAPTPAMFQLSVNPTAQGLAANTYTATVTFTSSTPGVAPVVLPVNLVIAPAPLMITQTSLPVATYGSPYLGGNGLQFTATGGTPPYSWTEMGALPQGIMLSSTGLLSGTPEAGGTFPIAVIVTDHSMPPMGVANVMALIVNGALVIETNATLPAATVNAAYSKTIMATGGMQPYTFAVATGSTLPGGLMFSAGGVLSGTPTTAGTYTFTLQVTDTTTPTPNVTPKTFTLMVN